MTGIFFQIDFKGLFLTFFSRFFVPNLFYLHHIWIVVEVSDTWSIQHKIHHLQIQIVFFNNKQI